MARLTAAKPGRTKRSAAKRFKVRGSGSVKAKKACHSHLLNHKSPARKRRLRAKFTPSTGNLKNIKKMIAM